MAVDMYLKLNGIDGESADDKHKKEIDVLAWSWSMSQSGTTHTATGVAAVTMPVLKESGSNNLRRNRTMRNQ